MKIYVASSWRNKRHPIVVDFLRDYGHEVFDFRRPEPGNVGFHWSEIDPMWEMRVPAVFRLALTTPSAKKGFQADLGGMEWADACVLLLPCGRSAHLEAGWFVGQGKPCYILLPEEGFEPELMYKLATGIYVNVDELVHALK